MSEAQHWKARALAAEAALADTRQALERIATGELWIPEAAEVAREALAGCRERTRQQDKTEAGDSRSASVVAEDSEPSGDSE